MNVRVKQLIEPPGNRTRRCGNLASGNLANAKQVAIRR
jgi:hypothetical protein